VEPTTTAAAVEATSTVVNHCIGYTSFAARAFCEGGTAMYFIAFVGLLTVLLILERFMSLQKLTVDKANFNESIYNMILRGDIRQAITFCDSKQTPLTNTLKAGLVQVLNKRPDEEVQVAMDASVLRETPRLEGWTQFLAVFGNVSVLIGLLGTIEGMIRSFRNVAAADPATKAQELTVGISEALNCTAFGLTVSIIAIVAYGFFQLRVGRAINDMLESAMNLMNMVVANRDKVQS
jgi:biopolymer transport protein ExbB